MSDFSLNNGVTTIKRCKHGTFAFFNSDDPIGSCLKQYGEWADQELEFISPFLQPNFNVIDVGANIGTHTVWFSKKCSQGYVHAIEPQFYIFEILNTNVLLNNAFNVKPYNAAVSNDYSSVRLLNLPPVSSSGINYGEFKLHDHEHGLETKCIKLDQFQNIQFIKMDVEGHELSALASGDALLKREKPLIYIEFNSHSGNPELLDYLWSLGYKVYWHVYEKHNPNNYHGLNVNIWLDDPNEKPTIERAAKFFEGNIFCVHKSEKRKLKLELITDRENNFISHLQRFILK